MTTASNRVARVACARRMVARLYEAVDDRRLSWLDELLISAGFLRRCCGCGAAAPTDESCPRCATTEADGVVDMFDVYRCRPEAVYPILALREGDPPLEIRIAAAGGGRLAAAYTDNDWIYGVWLDGALVCSGSDLRSGGISRTHWQMAVLLAECLADLVPASLRRHGERLGQWAFEQAHPESVGDRDVLRPVPDIPPARGGRPERTTRMNSSVTIERGYYLIDTPAWIEQRVARPVDDLTASLRAFVDLDVFTEYRSGMDTSARMRLWCAARDWVIAEGAPIYHDHGCLSRPVTIVLAAEPQPGGDAYALVRVEGDQPIVYPDVTTDEGYWNQVRAVDIVCPEGHRWTWFDDTSLLDERGHETSVVALFGSDRLAPFSRCRNCAAFDDGDIDTMCDCADPAVIYCPICDSRSRLALTDVPTHPQPGEVRQ